ncbi:SDR family oxidoreductase [Azotobacter sp. CWF10]
MINSVDRFRLDDRRVLMVGSCREIGFELARGLERTDAAMPLGERQDEPARPTLAPCAASKGALRMPARGLCANRARYGIQANRLAPGYFQTEASRTPVDDREFPARPCRRTPAGRRRAVEEPAVLLASPTSDFMLRVDGGPSGGV